MKAQIISTIAGNGDATYAGDSGPATNASISYFAGIALDDYGNIYIADINNQRIRKVEVTTGIIRTIAGTGVPGFSGDGGAATNAMLNQPTYIKIQGNNLFFSDYENGRVRKVDIASGEISTIAGNGSVGYTGDGGPATGASFYYVSGIAIDSSRNIFVADVGNGCIRKVDNFGIITTIGGNGTLGFSGDGGPATVAQLGGSLGGICTDLSGNVLIADQSNHRVRKIDVSTGIISTVAGYGTSSYNGDGRTATSAGLGPRDIFADRIGNLLVADFSNNRIREIDVHGIISTIVGNGMRSFSGDGGIADSAEISGPQGVIEDSCGNIYIADDFNLRVRKVTYETACYLSTSSLNISPIKASKIFVYPNPTNEELQICNIANSTNYQLLSALGVPVKQGILRENNNAISLGGLPAGMYLLEMIDEEGNKTVKKIIKE